MGKKDLCHKVTILTYEYKRMVPQRNRLSEKVKLGFGRVIIRLLNSLVGLPQWFSG